MSTAPNINSIQKKIDQPALSFWQRMFKRTSKREANLETCTSNGYQISVDRASIQLAAGEIFGLLAHRASGESAEICLISTPHIPSKREITILKRDTLQQPVHTKEMIHHVSVETSFFKELSPMENLIYGARLYGMQAGEARKKIIEILARLGIEKRSIYNPMDEMPRTTQQKIAFAYAFLSCPRLLILDEPTAGLDPDSQYKIWTMIQELRQEHGTTILLTTQDVSEAYTLCDHIAILNQGKVLALDTPQGLKTLISASTTNLLNTFFELSGKSPHPIQGE